MKYKITIIETVVRSVTIDTDEHEELGPDVLEEELADFVREADDPEICIWDNKHIENSETDSVKVAQLP